MEQYAIRDRDTKQFVVKTKNGYSFSTSPKLLKRRPSLPERIDVMGQPRTNLEVVTFVTEEALPPGVLLKNGRFDHNCYTMLSYHLSSALREGKRVSIKIVDGKTQMDISDV